MAFEVAPGPLRERGLLRAAIVGGCAIAIIAVAIISADAPTANPSSSSANVAVLPSSSSASGPPEPAVAAPGSGATAGPPVMSAPLLKPDGFACHDLDPVTCGEVAQASISALSPSDRLVAAISVWRSLLCNDANDCPPSRLDGNRPLGSSIVWLASGAQAWVNVVGPVSSADRGADPTRMTAWVIRWIP